MDFALMRDGIRTSIVLGLILKRTIRNLPEN